METPRDTYELALTGSALGLRFIPCRPCTKIPLVPWKHYQTEPPSQQAYAAWFRETRNNIAVLTNGMVLFDCDSPEKEELVLEHCGETPWKVRTPRGGVHLGYRKRNGVSVINQVRIKGEPIDIRTDGGIALLPDSVTEHGRYEFLGSGLVAVAELPIATIGWTRERTRRRVAQNIVPADGDVMVRRALAWVACVEGAVSGQHGHNRTFRVCCKLTHHPPAGFGLCYEAAWPILQLYNAVCEPPWTEKELEHKLTDAIKKRR